jgi:Predicted membrane protein
MTRRQRFYKMVALGLKQIRDPYYQGFAAQLAFYYMLSVVPTVILLSEAATVLLRSNLEQAVGWIMKYTGGYFGDTIKSLILGGSSATLNVLMIIVALWAASRAQFSMARICNFMYSEGKFTGSYWSERFRAIKTMSFTILAMILVLVVMVFGSQGITLLFRFWGFETDAQQAWGYIRWPVALALYILMLAYNYYVLPKEKITFKEVLPGAAFAGMGLLVITFFYAVYLARIANYNIMYGSLSTIVALLFWFWFLAWVLVLGVLFNKVWKDTKDYKSWDAPKKYDE